MDLISVIVPVFNVEQYFERCVTSLINQTYKNLEIILVDDGSTDNCPKMCDEFAIADRRIKVIHKENGGQGIARNSGLEIASGNYVTFVDSDDYLCETYIEKLYSALIKNKADMAICAYSVYTANKTVIPHSLKIGQGVYCDEKVTDNILLPIIGAEPNAKSDVLIEASCWAKLYNMQIIKENNVRFTSERVAISEDLFFNVFYLRYSKCVVALNEQGYFYCENGQSVTRKYNPLRYERTFEFYKQFCELIDKIGLKGKAAYRLQRSFLSRIRVLLRLIAFSSLSRKEKIAEIKRVLNNDVLQDVLNEYPIDSFDKTVSILVKAMKKRNAVAVLNVIKLRAVAKRILKH